MGPIRGNRDENMIIMDTFNNIRRQNGVSPKLMSTKKDEKSCTNIDQFPEMVHEIHIKRVFGHSSFAQSTKEKMIMALSNKNTYRESTRKGVR